MHILATKKTTGGFFLEKDVNNYGAMLLFMRLAGTFSLGILQLIIFVYKLVKMLGMLRCKNR